MQNNYSEICDAVWSLHESQHHNQIGNGQQRNLLFPPAPRGQQVDLLIVGISPNNDAPIRYSRDRPSIERFAHDFEYVSEAGCKDRQMFYDPYYGKLLNFVRCIHPQFGVWKQLELGQKKLLVEFTDCLHIATKPGDRNDIWRIFKGPTDDCPVWRRCKEILKAEILLYRPKVLIGNGRTPSEMLRQIAEVRSGGTGCAGFVHLNTEFGCNFHFSGFITRQETNSPERERLVNEIKRLLLYQAFSIRSPH
jgi:hypothetical protein